jgi:N-succinyldiaminopimelate aminotransferase
MSPAPRMTPRRASRLEGLGTTIFTEMTALAVSTEAINLGQGFPDSDGPSAAIEAAVEALRSGENQYAPLAGVPALREAVADHQRAYWGLEPEDILVTFGATEAIAAALLGLCDPGDEVVVLEPYYDSYAACIAFAGAKRRPVTLRPPDFALDREALRAAIGPRARVMLVNSPHNPTGRVLTCAELDLIAEACVERDLVCVSDEVYEHLVYDGQHVPPATLPGMAERTLTVSSIGKSFSFTGWKVGWCSGPAELVGATRAVKQYLTFAGGTPLQHAAAAALRLPGEHLETLRSDLRARRDRLCDGLAQAGLLPLLPAGTYFVNADVGTDAIAFCAELPERCGVVAIPTSVFYDDKDAAPTLVRFAFCKREEVIDEAARRLATLGAPGSARGRRVQ